MDQPPLIQPVEVGHLTIRGVCKELLYPEPADFKFVIPVNAELVTLANRNERFRQIVEENLATLDGHWPYFFARRKAAYVQKIPGSEFIFDVCHYAASHRLGIFFLGASSEVNLKAREILSRSYGIRVAGFSPPQRTYPFHESEDNTILSKIEESRCEVLVAAFGAPKQEFWIQDHRNLLIKAGVTWAIAVGGTLDMIAGATKRAPRLVRDVGAEGIWRVLHEPRKRFGRAVEALKFLRYV